MNANEIIADRVIRNQVYLQRYSGGVVNKMIALLNRADRDLVEQIRKRLEKIEGKGFDAGPAVTNRLQELLGEVRAINRAAYDQMGRELTDELRNLGEYQAEWTGSVLGEQLPKGMAVTQPPASLVRAAVTARPFQGRLLKEWTAGLEASKTARIRDSIRIGLVEGETIDQMVRRIRGTRALNYADGLMEIDRRGAAAMVRTAVNHTVTAARDELYKANDDIVKGLQWISTLDSRTTPVCQARDHKVYPLGSGPRPPAHIGCRSTMTPILKSWREMGIDIDEMPASTRASLDGQVPEDMNYGQWLKKQSATTQDEILGKDKGALYRTGKLPLEKFVDKSGKSLNLDALKLQQPVEYAKAGLDNPIRPPRGDHQDEIARFLASPAKQGALLRGLYGGSFGSNMDVVRRTKAAQNWTASEESLGAVRYYTGNGYGQINKRMREGSWTLEDRQFTALAVDALDGMEYNAAAVLRAPTTKPANAQKWWDRAVVGEELDLNDQLQSFSTSRHFAAGWARDADVLLRIPGKRPGAFIDKISQNPGEAEFLVPPGVKYRVIRKATETINGKVFRIIDLEVIDGN